MKVRIIPGTAAGMISAPPSKSMAHRYLIAAALAEGKSKIHGVAYSQDVLATIDCLRALGVEIKRESSTVTVCGGVSLLPGASLQCRESGSTLRFMIPLCLLSGKEATLLGSARLMERPQTVYEDLCRQYGFTFAQSDSSVTVKGNLQSGEYELDGGISSQFITGMLFALVKTGGKSVIRLKGKVESRSYIDLTLSALRFFGFNVRWAREGEALLISAGKGKAVECSVEGDYSNAAFFDALNLLNGKVSVTGLDADSLQGDRIYRNCFKALAEGTPKISLADCPDLGPILFAVAAALHGAWFTETARLRIKESDRCAAMAEELLKCGVSVRMEDNAVYVPGGQLTAPVEPIEGHNDHRIVMAMSVLLTRLGGTVLGAQAVSKSMPDFFDQLHSLGIEVEKDETE